MNGIGERTGNANLMTIIPTLQLKMGAPGVEGNLRNLTALSRFTDELVSHVYSKGHSKHFMLEMMALKYLVVGPCSHGHNDLIPRTNAEQCACELPSLNSSLTSNCVRGLKITSITVTGFRGLTEWGIGGEGYRCARTSRW